MRVRRGEGIQLLAGAITRITVGVPGTSILKMRVTTMMLARQMSAIVGVSPWQKAPVPGSPAKRCSNACKPVVNQRICEARQAASSRPLLAVRYFFTRGVMSGCVLAANERTRARPWASAGSSAGVAKLSSMNSRIASDWVSGVVDRPGPWSTSAGMAPIGFSFRKASLHCSPASRLMLCCCGVTTFRLKATHTQ